jgi:thiamine biosynthesis lipoprotein
MGPAPRGLPPATVTATAFVLAGCIMTPSQSEPAPGIEVYREIVMGTESVVMVEGVDAQGRLGAARAAMAELRACEEAMSDWHRWSERSRMPSTAGERMVVSDRLRDAIDRSLAIAAATDGRFDPTLSPVVMLWREARRTGKLPDDAALDAAVARTGWRHLHLEPTTHEAWFDLDGMALDFGGVGKGLAAQRASDILTAAGHPIHLVGVAGDIVCGPEAPPGRSGWEVRREDGLQQAIMMELLGEAVSTSGDLEQSIMVDGVRHSHIIDPRSGRALRRRTAACVRGPAGSTCDALATALCVAGVEGAPGILRAFPGYRASVTTLDDDGPLNWTTRPGPEGPPCSADVVTVPDGPSPRR